MMWSEGSACASRGRHVCPNAPISLLLALEGPVKQHTTKLHATKLAIAYFNIFQQWPANHDVVSTLKQHRRNLTILMLSGYLINYVYHFFLRQQWKTALFRILPRTIFWRQYEPSRLITTPCQSRNVGVNEDEHGSSSVNSMMQSATLARSAHEVRRSTGDSL